jgi:acyl-CoA thioesterase
MSLAEEVVNKMYENDSFSQWLGIERVKIEEGSALLKMVIKKEMTNGFGIAHGGIIFSLADSSLAFASNSYGRRSVSIEASISWTESLKEGDVVIATAQKVSLSNKVGIFDVEIKTDQGNLVGVFRGTVYRTSKDWFE